MYLNYRLLFIVESKRQYKEANNLCGILDDRSWECLPYFNGKNQRFFERNVLIGMDDILQLRNIQTAKDKRRINTYQVGNIIITEQGEVHTNTNEPAIGRLKESTLKEILQHTTLEGTSWKRLRTEVEPCRDCIVDIVCPSITNYEYALNSNKICTLNSRSINVKPKPIKAGLHESNTYFEKTPSR